MDPENALRTSEGLLRSAYHLTDGIGKRAQERELEGLLEELVIFAQTIRKLTDRVVSPWVKPDPADVYLVSLCKMCEIIAKEYQDEQRAAKQRRDRPDPTEFWTPDVIEKMQSRLTTLQKRFIATIVVRIW